MNQVTRALTPEEIARVEARQQQTEEKAAPAAVAPPQFVSAEGRTVTVDLQFPVTYEGALIDKVIFAKDRQELVAATRALDRVLLWNDFVVPQWYAPKVRIAYWDRYGQPATLPGLTPGFTQVWWFDKSLAAKLPGAPKL